MAGESQQIPKNEPDPTVITTENIDKAVDTLRELFEARIADMQRLLDERYATQTKAVDKALEAQQTAMRTAFDASEKAVDKALIAAEKAVDARAATLDREFHEHLEQVRHENALAFINSDKAIQAALTSAKEAVDKAEAATEKRFAAVNEFRGQLSDQANLFLPRAEYAATNNALTEQVSELKDRLNRTEGKDTGVGAAWGVGLGALGGLATIVGLVLILLSR